MTLFEKLRSMTGEYGRLDSEDLAAYWRLYSQLQRAESAEAAQVLLQRHGFADMAQWRRVAMAMGARYGDSPVFLRTARRATMGPNDEDKGGERTR